MEHTDNLDEQRKQIIQEMKTRNIVSNINNNYNPNFPDSKSFNSYDNKSNITINTTTTTSTSSFKNESLFPNVANAANLHASTVDAAMIHGGNNPINVSSSNAGSF